MAYPGEAANVHDCPDELSALQREKSQRNEHQETLPKIYNGLPSGATWAPGQLRLTVVLAAERPPGRAPG
jgi:hypothetical protein